MTHPSSRIGVAYVHPFSYVFGAERSLLENLRAIDQERFAPVLITVTEGPLEDVAQAADVPVVRLPWLRTVQTTTPLQWLRATWRFAHWLRARDIHIVQLNVWIDVDLSMLMVATWLAGAKFILRHRLPSCWLSLQDKFWLARADLIIAVSHASIAPWLVRRRSDLWSHIQPAKVRVVPLLRDVKVLTRVPQERAGLRALGIPDDVKIVGMVAALDPIKRQDLFLKAASIVRERDSTVWFVLVGGEYRGGEQSFYRQQLIQLIHDEGLGERVVLTGYRLDALRLMKGFDVLVLPSKRETFGGVLIEAMALGVPIVASMADGIPEVIRDDMTGLLVQQETPQAYAEAIHRLLTNGTLAERLRRTAQEHVKQFDSAHVVKQIEQCYEDLVQA